MLEHKKVMLSADRPTGKLHIGHYVGSLKRRVELQNSNSFDECYVMIADTQALSDNFENPDKIRENIIEVALDYLSIGIDPSKTTIFVQSRIPELFEITCYFLDLVTLSRLERNPTVKNELNLRGFEESIPAGFLCYPISQAADIVAFDTSLVPVGLDQAPMIEQCRELVHKFNTLFGETFIMPEISVPDTIACQRLPGIDGQNKMSKSLNNAIFLSDSKEEVKKKVMMMYTDPLHLKVEDKGHTENNPVFLYLDAFCTDEHFKKYWNQYSSLKHLKQAYEKGGLGDVAIKKFLNDVLNDILEPFRAKRRIYEQDISKVYKILQDGSVKAQTKAMNTVSRMRRAMKINYFEDMKLIEKQSKAFKKKIEQEENYKNYLLKQKQKN